MLLDNLLNRAGAGKMGTFCYLNQALMPTSVRNDRTPSRVFRLFSAGTMMGRSYFGILRFV